MKQKDFFINCPPDLHYIYDGHTVKLKNIELPHAFFPIIGVIAEDANFSISSVTFMNRTLDITGRYRGRESRCRIRFSHGPSNNIVVQNVMMIHQRHGYMTRIYGILKHIKRTYRTGEIIIESVVSDEGENWCRKNSFIPDGQGNFIAKR